MWIHGFTTTRGLVDIHGGLCYHQRTCRYLLSVLLSESTLTSMGEAATDIVGVCDPRCPNSAAVYLWSVLLPKDMMLSMVHYFAEGHADVNALYCQWRPCWCSKCMLTWEAMLISMLCTTAWSPVWIHGCAAFVSHIGVCGLCYHCKLCKCSWSVLSITWSVVIGSCCQLGSCWYLWSMLPLRATLRFIIFL